MADEILQEFNEFGVANTPTAGGAVRMLGRTQVVKRDGNIFLVMDLHTENSAVFDNATGALRVALLSHGVPNSSYTIVTDRNPGRGFQPATQRDAHQEQEVPKGLAFDGLGFTFYNQDHAGPEMLNIDNIGKAVSIAKNVVDIVKTVGEIAAPNPTKVAAAAAAGF